MNIKNNQNEITIRDVHLDDLLKVAEIHKKAFSDSALTSLGIDALRRYYEWQIIGPHDCSAIGAFMNTQMTGFCFGGIFRGALSGFLNKNKVFLIFLIITHPWLLTNSIVKDRIKLATLSINGLKKNKNIVPKMNSPSFGILSIAVDPSYQKSGIGKLLMDKSELIAFEKGIRTMTLTVHTNNLQAIKFYEYLGWKKKLTLSGVWEGAMEKCINENECNLQYEQVINNTGIQK